MENDTESAIECHEGTPQQMEEVVFVAKNEYVIGAQKPSYVKVKSNGISTLLIQWQC